MQLFLRIDVIERRTLLANTVLDYEAKRIETSSHNDDHELERSHLARWGMKSKLASRREAPAGRGRAVWIERAEAMADFGTVNEGPVEQGGCCIIVVIHEPSPIQGVDYRLFVEPTEFSRKAIGRARQPFLFSRSELDSKIHSERINHAGEAYTRTDHCRWI